ncbi:DMSO/TMAO reductase YedYZ molybdopterin-dependent catalytic subunit [Sphingomonas jejuensis]|uniref:DMSO/TMAO reductase YedYZ molybdopterin-dependent catalytic subunit n=1 Tax=Sphingomonas jejuensis TaxID=904715 RepID=A0ABX0XQM5_9SPHN|nr:molybdopterin-binding protein [Sphingomonas jejuensis]NJC35001.1 DMSO/TMAO reductase YedYZ molybdopterin-dependent catalytic subunit [Sphingomonas jejuensis]
MILTRRALVTGAALGAGGLLSGCDALNGSERFQRMIALAEGANLRIQRAVTARGALAREYRPEERSPVFRSNGTAMPSTPLYQNLLAGGFADWRLAIDGLVARPLSLSLGELTAMPAREQITRHDCVEGWSAIGKWRGVPLAGLLDAAGVRPSARYLVFHCADLFGSAPYYESIDMVDARHPQTILAYALNDRMLPVANGAPLRLRVERQLGYKHAKYLMRVEARDTLAGIGQGKGGFWEDVAGYEWYAGI